ncbi:MAG: DUF5063 domain-containing protein [Bacteroidales bacterium]|nr:DUF5063 domain-containing protein [Bacteroidales bacterium]
MEKENGNILYSRQVLEFVTVANEYCKFLENLETYNSEKFISTAHKLLPFLYMKTALLPDVVLVMDEQVDKLITQEDWTAMQAKISSKLGAADLFFLMKNPQSLVSDEEIELTVSEVFTDIYQDLSDFTHLYRLGNEDIMNDALLECKNSFEQYWGKRLLALLNQLHYIIYESDDDEIMPSKKIKDKKTEWFLDDE